MHKWFALVLLSLAVVNPALADLVGSGTGFVIPDNNQNGVASTITFSDDLIVTGNLVVTLSGLNHTYVGDVTATLIAPDLTTHTLFFRIGRTTTTGTGDSSDFGGDYVFSDAATGDIWAEAASRNAITALGPGAYRTTGEFSSAFTTMDSVFAGKSTLGNWTLRMADLSGGDSGSLAGWSLSMSAVPEPNSLTLLALAGLTVVAKRRRR
jgi:subtilisin-like proprotein convertase family protein